MFFAVFIQGSRYIIDTRKDKGALVPTFTGLNFESNYSVLLAGGIFCLKI